MADIQEPNSFGEGKHGIARRLVDVSTRAQRDGDPDEAERLMGEAIRVDPQAVEDALMESRQGSGPSAKLDAAEVGDDAAVAAMTRTVEPGSDAPSRSGVTGSGSGADG